MTGSSHEGDFSIQPYIGVDRLHFGMSLNEVENLVGPPVLRDTGFLGETIEYRWDNGLLTTYDQKKCALVEIGISRNIINLEFDNIYIFTMSPQDVLAKLVQLDGDPYESLGFIVLLKLGITLTGFHDDAVEQKSVTVFERGRWDDLIPELKPFHLIR